MFEIMDTQTQEAVIKVIGIGGCGGNAVDHMIQNGVQGVEFICANTDAQALKRNQARTLLQMGSAITKGLGAGADPEVGRNAALEDRDRIAELIEGADMLFITAGMGGGTGTGAAPVVAQVAKELGILTVAVVTKPFSFEGRRLRAAQAGMDALSQYVDSLIVIPNDKLMSVLGEDISMLDAFKAANNVLYGAVAGIAEVINCPGLVNVDFADVKTVMSEMGMAMMGSAFACRPWPCTGRGGTGCRQSPPRRCESFRGTRNTGQYYRQLGNEDARGSRCHEYYQGLHRRGRHRDRGHRDR